MPEKTSYAPGTPSWVDLSSPDLDRSIEFYSGLFGWDYDRGGEDVGGYTMCSLGGRNVAGLGPIQGEGQPAAWMTYFTVEDADATAKAVEAGGGMVLAPPFDVMDVGRMAVFMDTVGAAFSIWQPRAHIGAQVVNEPNTLCWNELNTRQPEEGAQFYADLLGLGLHKNTNDDGSTAYIEIQVDGESVGGILPMPEMVPAEVPSHWLVYFAVDDDVAATEKVKQLGGATLAPGIEVPDVGRFSVVAGPHGEAFAVIKLSRTT